MKVTSLNQVYSSEYLQKTNKNRSNVPVRQNLPAFKTQTMVYNTYPQYQIQVPVSYTNSAIDDLPNGLKLYSYKLSNGYRVSIVPMENSPAVVKTYVNVGSMNETPDIKGISHFLEHMAFNGSNGENGHIKLNTGDSFKKIDELGGWANASTNYALTDYVNSSPQLNENDIYTQIKVLAAMSEDLKLSDDMIKKEKGPVSSEINMILDDPKTIALDQTLRSLFNINNPADELVGGSVSHIQNLTKKDVVDYYNKYYTPENTNIVVTGDVDPDEVIKMISKSFVSKKIPSGKRYEEPLIPIKQTVRKDFLSDKTKSAEVVLGFVGPENNNIKEKIIYHIASMYIQSESAGIRNKLHQKYNADFFIGDERVTTNPKGNRMVYIGSSSLEENSEKVLKTILNSIKSIKPIEENELTRIKETIKENRSMSFEYSQDVNNIIGNALLEEYGKEYILKYIDILDKITPEEVNEGMKKIFNPEKTAITVIHPTNNLNKPSFKGKKKVPLDETKISKETLENNFDVGFYKTNSQKEIIQINLKTDKPYIGKPGVREILNEIYSMGTQSMDESEFNNYLENLNLNISTYAGTNGIGINLDGNLKNYQKGLKIINDLLYNPRINEETLSKSKKIIKEELARWNTSAESLYYNNFYAKYSDSAFSKQEILNALDSITIDDVKDFHQYVLDNSRGIVSCNLPDENGDDVKTFILETVSDFKPVHENLPITKNNYKKIKKPIVLTAVQNNSQADIMQVYNFKYNDTIKNRITADLMNSILSNSSIGLFDVLREKEQLAYSVYSDITVGNDNSGEISLNILTTTDNKNNGEIHYDNVEKSIKGFHRQINELVNGNFTNADLENVKRIYKATLLNNEGVYSKVASITSGLNVKEGINYKNKVFNEIDSVTKDDIINFANNVFSEKPVYSISATKDTLVANNDFLSSLKSE